MSGHVRFLYVIVIMRNLKVQLRIMKTPPKCIDDDCQVSQPGSQIRLIRYRLCKSIETVPSKIFYLKNALLRWGVFCAEFHLVIIEHLFYNLLIFNTDVC